MVPATVYKTYPWNEDTSFNQDILSCSKGVWNRGVPLYHYYIAGIPPEQNPNWVLNDIHRLLIKLWL